MARLPFVAALLVAVFVPSVANLHTEFRSSSKILKRNAGILDGIESVSLLQLQASSVSVKVDTLTQDDPRKLSSQGCTAPVEAARFGAQVREQESVNVQVAKDQSADLMATAAPSSDWALSRYLTVLAILIAVDRLRRSGRKDRGEKSGIGKVAISACSGGEGQTVGRRLPEGSRAGHSAWEALMKASQAGDDLRCMPLLSRLQDDELLREDAWGCSVLHAAAKGGAINVIRHVLDSHPAAVDFCDVWDETPLHFAARAGHVKVCELLLEHGADMDALNASAHTPLFESAAACQESTSKLLLERGAGVAGMADSELPTLLRSLLVLEVIRRDDGHYKMVPLDVHDERVDLPFHDGSSDDCLCDDW